MQRTIGEMSIALRGALLLLHEAARLRATGDMEATGTPKVQLFPPAMWTWTSLDSYAGLRIPRFVLSVRVSVERCGEQPRASECEPADCSNVTFGGQQPRRLIISS